MSLSPFNQVLGPNEIYDTCSSVLNNSLRNGMVEATLHSKKKGQALVVTPIVANEKFFLRMADLIESQYLLCKETTPPEISAIKVYYSNDCVVEWLPAWLIDYFLQVDGTGGWRKKENTWLLPLPFLRALLPNSELQVECEASDVALQLVSRCTYVVGDERQKLLDGFTHSQHQTQSMRVKGNALRQPLGFQVMSNEMVISNAHCDDIEDVQILLHGRPHLHYNKVLLALYAKNVAGKYLRIFYNHQDGTNFGSSINHSLNDDAMLIITWRQGLQLDEPVNVAVSGLNSSRVGGDKDQLICTTFSINNLGKIRAPVASTYSMHEIGDNVFVEGYWWDGNWQDTSMPIPLPATEPVAQRYINWLREIWTHAADDGSLYKRLCVFSVSYLGSSTCRICRCTNGSREMNLRNTAGVSFRIPQGFIHYLEQHNIHISPQLATFLDQACIE